MPRLAGIDIPERKKILFALQYIHGIGPKFAKDILVKTGIDGDRKASTLDDKELANISQLLDQNYSLEGETTMNIKRLMDIGCYRGFRHRRGLPMRGQRTRTNARTRKGKKRTVAGKKGVKG